MNEEEFSQHQDDMQSLIDANTQQWEGLGYSAEEPVSAYEQDEEPEEPPIVEPEELEQPALVNTDEQKEEEEPSTLQTVAEAAAAVPISLLDFGIDAVTTVGGFTPLKDKFEEFDDGWDELTKFDNPIIQKVRKFSSVVVPTFLGTGAVLNGVRGLKALGLSKGAMGAFGLGGTAAVDAAVVGLSDEGFEDNLARTMSDTFPTVFGPMGALPIPKTWKTLDGDSPEIRKQKNMYESVGFSIVGDLLGFVVAAGKKPLQWFTPKDAKATQFKADEIAKGDPETMQEILKIDQALAAKKKPKDAKQLKERRGFLLKQLADTGTSDVSTRTPLEKYVDDASVSRDVQNEDLAIQQLELDLDGNYNNLVTPGLAKPGATAQQSIPPANVARNMADTSAIKQGKAVGDPAPVLTEPFVNKALRAGEHRKAVLGVAEASRDASNFDATVNGFRITAKDMKDDAWKIYTDIMRPGMDPKAIRDRFFPAMDVKQLADGTQVRFFSEKQTLASALAINDLVDLYLGREVTESSARIMDTFGREISSITEGAKNIRELADDDRVMDMVLDKLEFLMSEHALNKYIAGWSLRQKQKPYDILAEAIDIDSVAKVMKEEFDAAMTSRQKSIKQFRQTLVEAKAKNPEYIRPLFDAFAMSHGDVDTIAKLTKWAQDQITPMGILKSPDPGQMNLMARGFWGVRYNNVLSGLAAVRAFTGNGAAVINKVVTSLLGHGIEAIVKRDMEPIKRAMYYHSAVRQTSHRALSDAIQRIRQVHADPQAFERAIRKDYIVQNEKKWETLALLNEAWEKEGNWGMQYQYNVALALHHMSKMKWMRYGTTGMAGIDAATDTFMATALSRVRAYDEVFTKYGKVTPELLAEAEKKSYSNMFDANGLITDEAVKNASGEVALNLDDGVATFINTATQNVPIMKRFFMFPRTSMNMMKMASSYTPISLIPGINKYSKVLTAGNDIDKIKDALSAHGIKNFDDTPNAMAIYKNLKAEYTGRVAMGGLVATTLFSYAMAGNIRGNGPINGSERKKLRDNYNYREKTINIGGNWVSYAGIPPFDPMLTMIGDLAYYANDIGQSMTENVIDKIAWTISATWLNNTPLEGIEPILKMLNGDEAAMQRMLAQEVRTNIPLSGALGVVSNAITSAQKDIYKDFMGYVANRLPVASSTLPVRIDYWTGKPINDIDNPFLRGLNAVNPIPISGGAEPWRQWLYNTGWPGMDFLTRHSEGYEYTAEQREAIATIVGEMQLWKEIDKLRRNKRFNEELDEMREVRNNPNSTAGDIAVKESRLPVYRELTKITNRAKKIAEQVMENKFAEIEVSNTAQKRSYVLTELGRPKEAAEVVAEGREQVQQIRRIRDYGNN